MQPWKIGVKTNMLMMMKDVEFISGKKLLKQINEMKAATTVYFGQSMSPKDLVL